MSSCRRRVLRRDTGPAKDFFDCEVSVRVSLETNTASGRGATGGRVVIVVLNRSRDDKDNAGALNR